MAILLGVRAVAIPILEIDPEILDRFGGQLGADPFRNRTKCRVLADSKRLAQAGGIGRIPVHRAQRESAKLGNRIGAEELRAAIDGMDRLAAGTLAWVRLRECDVGLAERRRGVSDEGRIEARRHPL